MKKIFFGWWIVGASFIILFYGGGIVHYGFTAIFEPIVEEMGWSYTQVSAAASLRGFEMGLLAPVVGLLIDRWGPRRLALGGAIAMGGGLFLLSVAKSLTVFYLAFFIISAGMSFCTTTIVMTTIAYWFRKKIGIATGIANCGFGASGVVVIIVVWLVATFDWRMSVAILAIGTLVILVPLSLLFRHKPEDYGLFPDGEEPAKATESSKTEFASQMKGKTPALQIIKSATFWHLSIPFMIHSLALNAVIIHIMPYLSSVGIARSLSGSVAMILSIISIGGRIGFGWFSDRSTPRLAATATFAVASIGILCFAYTSLTTLWLLIPFLILFGMGFGGTSVLRAVLVKEFLGRDNFATAFGFLIGVQMIGSIVGPTMAGWTYDNWGSYSGIWLILSAIILIAPVLIYTLPHGKVTYPLTERF